MGDMLSQEELNALLGNGEDNNNGSTKDKEFILTDEKKDILGEVGNISMGTSATTLFSLLNHKVEISTPTVSIIDLHALSKKHDRPCVALKINYKEGLVGANLLVLKQEDVKIISNLMMGGDGKVDENQDITDLELSAISEAMNQMVGSSATSLSSMLGYKIDIDTPNAFLLTFKDDEFFQSLKLGSNNFVYNSFRMVVGDLIDSEIMQLFPIEFANNIIEKLTNSQENNKEQKSTTIKNEQQESQSAHQHSIQSESKVNTKQSIMTQTTNVMQNNVNVQTAQFKNFDMNDLIQQKENITIIKEVPLEVTVELGRTKKPIKEILEFNPGTVIELDKLAGEPIDILVNGKFVARGEVVVIDENFGVRVTDIISVEERI